MKPSPRPFRGLRPRSIAAIAAALAGIVACQSGGGEDPAPQPDLRPAPVSIDEAVQRRLDDAGLDVTFASDAELCRRIYADLIGRFPTADEVAGTCSGQESATIIEALLGTAEYVVHGQRRWRDRIASSDASLLWLDLMPAYDVVAQMLRGELDYEQFAIALMAEPGLMALDPDPESRAYRVHRAFLGGEPTQAMAQDLARLTRIWDRRAIETPGAAFSGLVQEVSRATIVPGHCGPLGACRTDLYDGGSIEFPEPGARPFRGIKYELLTEEQRASLRGLGEHVISLPWFWEAAADEVLDRLLGWNDGGSEPRRPGRVLPEVRALVLQHLQETKDLRSAERLVMNSLLYRQSNRDAEVADPAESTNAESGDADVESMLGARPIWASGPLKFTPAEVVLNTMLGSSAAEGTCDPRTADDDIYRLNLIGFFNDFAEADVVSRYNAHITEFHKGQGNWRPLVEQEVTDPDDPEQTAIVLHLDPSYFETARAFGGCAGAHSPRLTALDGLSYAFGQEVAANIVCEGPLLATMVGNAAGSAAIASTLMARLFSRAPSAQELEVFADLACEGAACADAELARGICVALVGAHEMLFY